MSYTHFRLNFAKRVLWLIAVCCGTLFSSELVLVNHVSPITVNSFLMSGDTLFAASSGGLQVHNVKSGAAQLLSDAKMFPDPHLTALCRDAKGNLWMGSQKGYLYKRTPRGQFSVYSSYKLAGWGITCLYTHDGLIVVGSDKGVSLFDPQKGIALRNAANIGGFSDPRVNTITVFKDTLFIGCNEGLAYLDGLNSVPLNRRNFYDAAIWETEKSDAPIVSFINAGSFISPQAAPAVIFRGRIITSDNEGWILSNGERWRRVTGTGKIVNLYSESERRLWIGTDEMFYFSFNGDDNPQQHRIEGLALKGGTRLLTARNGDVWALSKIDYRAVRWHHGVYRYDGSRWHLYNGSSHGGYGYLGDFDPYGITEGRDGTIWVGTWGGNVKHINSVNNTVGQLIVGNRDFRNINYMANGVDGEQDWGKVDALATDSSGFIWMSVYDHSFGSLMCYNPRFPPNSAETDPAKAHYRHFFPGSPLADPQLSVDAENRIFFSDNLQSKLTVFRYNGNPLVNGIIIDTTYHQIGMISAIRSADDGTTYISATTGLRRVRAGETKLEMIDETLSNITSMAIQGERLWLGTRTNGILRYNTADSAKTWINEANGLLSNSIFSLALDSKRGRLWIMSEGGVSQLDAGRESKVTSSEPVFVFPNVFSISRSNQGASSVTFARLEPNSIVSVYAVSGVLIDKVSAQPFTEREWRAYWTPKRSLTPGTYFAVVKPSGKKTKIILKP